MGNAHNQTQRRPAYSHLSMNSVNREAAVEDHGQRKHLLILTLKATTSGCSGIGVGFFGVKLEPFSWASTLWNNIHARLPETTREKVDGWLSSAQETVSETLSSKIGPDGCDALSVVFPSWLFTSKKEEEIKDAYLVHVSKMNGRPYGCMLDENQSLPEQTEEMTTEEMRTHQKIVRLFDTYASKSVDQDLETAYRNMRLAAETSLIKTDDNDSHNESSESNETDDDDSHSERSESNPEENDDNLEENDDNLEQNEPNVSPPHVKKPKWHRPKNPPPRPMEEVRRPMSSLEKRLNTKTWNRDPPPPPAPVDQHHPVNTRRTVEPQPAVRPSYGRRGFFPGNLQTARI